MNKNMREQEKYVNQPGGFLAGLLIGGVAGAGAMLLLAPQSGKRTRAQIQLKGMELQEQTTEAVEDAVAQTRGKARQIKADVRGKAEDLQHRGQAMLDEQGERLSAAVESGMAAVRRS